MDPEVVRDLLDRHAGLAVPCDTDHVITELTRVRLGHSNILPAHPAGQANSDVTYPCSRPELGYMELDRRGAELLFQVLT